MINVPVTSMIQRLRNNGRMSGFELNALVAGGLPHTLEAFQTAAIYARNYWSRAAMGELFSGPFRMRTQYAEAIQASAAWDYPANGDPWHVIITPDQKIAAQAEGFVAPYDMKPGILSGPNAVRYDKQGNIYKMIPFKHSSSKLHQDIVTAMKEKAPTISRLIGDRKLFAVQWGGRLEKSDLAKLSADLTKPGIAKRPDIFPLQTASGAGLKEYQHKTSKYLGMVRVQQAYESAIQNQLMTWRYMGHKSPPWAWWHPGFQANPILQQILPHVTENFKNAVREGLAADINAILKGQR